MLSKIKGNGKHSETLDGIDNWYSHYGEQYAVTPKTRNISIMHFNNIFYEYMLGAVNSQILNLL